MKKTLLIALTVIGASVIPVKADVAFSISFGTPRACYTPPPVYCPPARVYYSAPVYTAPVYTAPVYTTEVYAAPVYVPAPVYAPVAPVCPPTPVVVGGYYSRGHYRGYDEPKFGYGHPRGGHGFQGGYGYKH